VFGLLVDGGERNTLYNSTGASYPNTGIFDITINPEQNVSIIRIEKPTGIITICEIEVYEGNADFLLIVPISYSVFNYLQIK